MKDSTTVAIFNALPLNTPIGTVDMHRTFLAGVDGRYLYVEQNTYLDAEGFWDLFGQQVGLLADLLFVCLPSFRYSPRCQ